jgi:hypothetical protein
MGGISHGERDQETAQEDQKAQIQEIEGKDASSKAKEGPLIAEASQDRHIRWQGSGSFASRRE